MFFMCCEKLSLGSRVMPSIVGNLLVASRLLLIDKCSVVEYSAGSGVKRVVWVLLLLIWRLLVVDHSTISLRYGWRASCAVSMLV